MAIARSEIYPVATNLTDQQQEKVHLAETALDALLKLHGFADVWLPITKDHEIKEELRRVYTEAGWNVEFFRAGTTNCYIIKIT